MNETKYIKQDEQGKVLEQSTTITNSDSDSITLKKGAKGYMWEIKVYGQDFDAMKFKLDNIDQSLDQTYNKE